MFIRWSFGTELDVNSPLTHTFLVVSSWLKETSKVACIFLCYMHFLSIFLVAFLQNNVFKYMFYIGVFLWPKNHWPKKCIQSEGKHYKKKSNICSAFYISLLTSSCCHTQHFAAFSSVFLTIFVFALS